MKKVLEKLSKTIQNPSYIPWKIKTTLAPKVGLLIKRTKKRRSNNGLQKKIAMIHIGRSGSTALADLLNQHPDIYWDGEVFRKILRQKKSRSMSLNDLNQYIDNQARTLNGLSYGYEIKFFHMDSFASKTNDQIKALKENGTNYFVVLERKNYLRKIISSVKASKLGVWHKPKSATLTTERITLPINNVSIDGKNLSLIDHLKEYRDRFEELKNIIAHENHLWITYERDISTSPENAFRKICQFVDLPATTVKVNYGKTNPQPIEDLIDNFDEVVKYLNGTDFEWMSNS